MQSIKFHFPIPITIAIKILQLIAIAINCVPSLSDNIGLDYEYWNLGLGLTNQSPFVI